MASPRAKVGSVRRRMSLAMGIDSSAADAARLASHFNPNRPQVKVMGGWMEKAGQKNTAWKTRWFELVDHDTLTYTTQPGRKPKGVIDLHFCQRVMASHDSPVLLELATCERQYQLRCDTAQERNDWIAAIHKAAHALHAGKFEPDLSEDPQLQQQRKDAWAAWQDVGSEPRASALASTLSSTDSTAASEQDFNLLDIRIERTLVFDKHVEYELVTTFEPADGESGAAAQESLVSRRYSEFRKLEKAICDVFEGLPPVPGKTISRHGSSAAGAGEGGQTRLDGLTRFLGELPEQAGSGRNRHVLQFLGVISAGVLTGNDERKLLFHQELKVLQPLAEKYGWLWKEGQRNKSRKKRWAVLVSGSAVDESWGDSGNRWLLYYEGKDARHPNGTVELPSEGYTVTWSAPPAADAMGMGSGPPGAAGAAAPQELQIEIQILYGNDQGRRLVVVLDTEEIWISWLTTLRGGAQQPPQPWGHQRPRNPTAPELAQLEALQQALPPSGSVDNADLDPADAALLQRFWNAFFGDDAAPFTLKGEAWKRAGFQRDDPVSDLRAAGRMALQQLVYFVEQHGEIALPMCKAQQGDDALAYYPWATAGVSVTQMLASCFELMQPSGVTAYFPQARRSFWAYIGDARVGREAYDLLYCIGFELLDREYRTSGGTYLTFPHVLSRTRDAFSEALLATSPDPRGPFATALRVATDLCSPLVPAIGRRLQEELARAPSPLPPPEVAAAEIALTVEDSAGVGSSLDGVRLAFPAEEIGDVGELMRRCCHELGVGKGLGEDFGWSFEGGSLRPRHSIHFEVFDEELSDWFTPDDLGQIAGLQRLRLRPLAS